MDLILLKHEAAQILVDKDALHIYVAIVIQISFAILTRRSLGHALPWLAVLAIEMINEVHDGWLGYSASAGAHDIINTMVLPTVLLLLCRYAPRILTWNERQTA